MRTMLAIAFLLVVCNDLPAQLAESARTVNPAEKSLAEGIMTFRDAYNAWDAGQFREAEKQIERAIEGGLDTYLPHYWAGVVNFHLVNFYLFGGKEDTDEKKSNIYIERALQSLEASLQLNDRDPESRALKGTLFGIKIYQKPYLAPFLGPKVFGLLEKALEIEPENPRIHYLIGMSHFFTPGFLGGGVKKGLAHLLEADKLFEKEAGIKNRPFEPRWGHSTCLGFIGKSYMKLDNSEASERYFKKALTINPQDKLAKSGLNELTKLKGE